MNLIRRKRQQLWEILSISTGGTKGIYCIRTTHETMLSTVRYDTARLKLMCEQAQNRTLSCQHGSIIFTVCERITELSMPFTPLSCLMHVCELSSSSVAGGDRLATESSYVREFQHKHKAWLLQGVMTVQSESVYTAYITRKAVPVFALV